MKIALIPVLMILFLNCSNGSNTKSGYDSLETNPHAAPSRVDTITHEDGLSNQSPVPSDTQTMDTRKRDSLVH